MDNCQPLLMDACAGSTLGRDVIDSTVTTTDQPQAVQKAVHRLAGKSAICPTFECPAFVTQGPKMQGGHSGNRTLADVVDCGVADTPW